MRKKEKISLKEKQTKLREKRVLAKEAKEKISQLQKDRGAQYNHPDLGPDNILENFTNIGRAWGAILASYYGKQLPNVPPHLVSHMMVALKTIRATVPSAYQQDDYDDGEVYLKYASRMDPKNPNGDSNATES